MSLIATKMLLFVNLDATNILVTEATAAAAIATGAALL